MQQHLTINSLIIDAINEIEASQKRLAVVLSSDGKLLGTLTDGDIRRSLLSGGDINSSVKDAMNAEPVYALEGTNNEALFALMQTNNILAIPIVTQSDIFKEIRHISEISSDSKGLIQSEISEAVVMAGGEGMRLRPITEKIPKPMVNVGGVPLLERQINKLTKSGITKIYLAVNYLSEVIEDYFQDGSNYGITIEYIKENQSLGTCGALSLIPSPPKKPFLVMNGDVLTNSSFQSLAEFHSHQSSDITVAAFAYNLDIPFGVIEQSDNFVKAIIEKPSQKFLCNAGIYVLSPKTIEAIPKGMTYNMTDLINDYLEKKKHVSIFPIHEYWSDIGTSNDLNKAREIYNQKNENK